MDTAIFEELHNQVLRAVDDKFRSTNVFRTEAGQVNNAMKRVDASLLGLKEIVSGLMSTAARRSGTASKTLNDSMSGNNSLPDLVSHVENYRNEVDYDMELNKKINAISDLVYTIGVDAKLLEAKARMIALSESVAELERTTGEIRAVQARITRSIAGAAKAIGNIKSSGYVDETIAAIRSSFNRAGTSLATIAAAQRKVLDSMAFVESSVQRIRTVSREQASKSELQVNSIATEQEQFVAGVGKRVEQFTGLLIAVSLTIIVLVLILSVSTIISVLRPLNSLTETITTIATTGDFTRSATNNSRDEVGITVQAFNSLIANFTQIIETISRSSNQLAATSRELNNATRGIHTTLDQQSDKVGLIAEASREMSRSITVISSNSGMIAHSTADARSVAETGAMVVRQTGDEVREIARAVEASTAAMQTLHDRSTQVGEIVDVIMAITDQTNLLALNAAIEAARAGEHGRGFAIVADEVRKLAQSTAEATVGITERIRGIQQDADQAVRTMRGSLQRVRTGVEHAGQAGTALEGIVHSIEQLGNMACEIASATEHLTNSAEQISIDMTVIDQVSRQAVQSTTTIADESANLAQLSDGLRNEVSRFTYC
jgi:methyl-accepting chemotaxis protein